MAQHVVATKQMSIIVSIEDVCDAMGQLWHFN